MKREKVIRTLRFRSGGVLASGFLALAVLAAGLAPAGCAKKEEKTAADSTSGAVHSAPPGSTLYLAEAQFVTETGPDGKSRPVPGPARLSIWTSNESGWTEEVLEDPESNVFHKAAWYSPPAREPGILTIGATKAFLKIWRKAGDGWEAEVLWNPTFGGKWDRLRDFEIADVTGDGTDDIVVATHDQGVIGVVSWTDAGWKAEEIGRRANTFVHEIEVGDVDGDGVIEIFTTPSLPNKLDGTPQPGEIDLYEHAGGEWVRRIVDTLATRHAKEILCVTLQGEARPVLLASLEGESIGGTEASGDSTRIRLYRFEEGGIEKTDIAGLPGNLCRFLTYGDTDGDGTKELVASTKSNGIWKLTPPKTAGAEWEKTLLATGTSGFEHATTLADFDGDGKSAIYVASDDQKELRCYWYEEGTYRAQSIGALANKPITFNITAHEK
ncbi:MAG: VCBS repeat-containing protein [Candidatus Eisenbacteria bacterium]